jgi:hypothetical protein
MVVASLGSMRVSVVVTVVRVTAVLTSASGRRIGAPGSDAPAAGEWAAEAARRRQEEGARQYLRNRSVSREGRRASGVSTGEMSAF